MRFYLARLLIKLLSAGGWGSTRTVAVPDQFEHLVNVGIRGFAPAEDGFMLLIGMRIAAGREERSMLRLLDFATSDGIS